MVRYRIDVGREHGVEVRDIVGAIANEAGIEPLHRPHRPVRGVEHGGTAGRHAAEAANALKRTRIRGVPINLRQDEGRPGGSFGGERKFDGERSLLVVSASSTASASSRKRPSIADLNASSV
jgi:ATP-dependent RNA helicase DeaD